MEGQRHNKTESHCKLACLYTLTKVGYRPYTDRPVPKVTTCGGGGRCDITDTHTLGYGYTIDLTLLQKNENRQSGVTISLNGKRLKLPKDKEGVLARQGCYTHTYSPLSIQPMHSSLFNEFSAPGMKFKHRSMENSDFNFKSQHSSTHDVVRLQKHSSVNTYSVTPSCKMHWMAVL